ncbi:hypothetical protein Tco_0090865 [Tanacetum coccineum]
MMGFVLAQIVDAAAASLTGCSILTAPFNYLGVKVGSNMSRINSWDNVIFKVPIGVLNHLESIRRISFMELMVPDRSLLGLLKYGSNLKKECGSLVLDTHKLIPRRSPWQDVILVIHSLQRDVALKVLYKRLYALEICKSISVGEKIGHPSLSHSFRRMPRGGVEQESLLFTLLESC